jgi:hypothetical protein
VTGVIIVASTVKRRVNMEQEITYIADLAQRRQLINITLETMQRYVQFCQIDDLDSLDSVDMYMSDISYMTDAVKQFAATGDLDEFENAVMWQDTFVREYYIDTLHAIDSVKEELYYAAEQVDE